MWSSQKSWTLCNCYTHIIRRVCYKLLISWTCLGWDPCYYIAKSGVRVKYTGIQFFINMKGCLFLLFLYVYFLSISPNSNYFRSFQPSSLVKYKIFKEIAWIWSHHLHLQWKFKFWAGKFTWSHKSKLCWVMSTNKKFVHNTQQYFAFTPQANFPAHKLNFYWSWRWWDQIQAIF